MMSTHLSAYIAPYRNSKSKNPIINNRLKQRFARVRLLGDESLLHIRRVPQSEGEGPAGDDEGGTHTCPRATLQLLRRTAGRLSGRTEHRRQSRDRSASFLWEYVLVTVLYPFPLSFSVYQENFVILSI